MLDFSARKSPDYLQVSFAQRTEPIYGLLFKNMKGKIYGPWA
jgi:hypothetical protein